MARNTGGILTDKWADEGDRTDPDDPTLTPPLDRAVGWDVSYSQLGGNIPRRAVWNQIMREMSGFAVDASAYGSIPQWSEHVDYIHYAFTMRHGRLYVSLADSGPASGDATDPAQAGNTKWRLY